MKVETDINASIAESPIGRVVILVKTYVGDLQNRHYCFYW